MAGKTASTLKIYELQVELESVEPLIWRRLLVPASIKLSKLHKLLQRVMGWTNFHLHSFQIGERTFSTTDSELDELDRLDEGNCTLETQLGPLKDFVYEYDFGDSWRHRIKVWSVTQPKAGWYYPLCTAGERAAPPEDVGGPSGYRDFLMALKDSKHEAHEAMRTWVGGVFDPEGFDLNAINRALRQGPL